MVRLKMKTPHGDIVVSIDKGEVSEDYIGFRGKTCKDMASRLAKSLKTKRIIESEEDKPELYEEVSEYENILA